MRHYASAGAGGMASIQLVVEQWLICVTIVAIGIMNQ